MIDRNDVNDTRCIVMRVVTVALYCLMGAFDIFNMLLPPQIRIDPASLGYAGGVCYIAGAVCLAVYFSKDNRRPYLIAAICLLAAALIMHAVIWSVAGAVACSIPGIATIISDLRCRQDKPVKKVAVVLTSLLCIIMVSSALLNIITLVRTEGDFKGHDCIKLVTRERKTFGNKYTGDCRYVEINDDGDARDVNRFKYKRLNAVFSDDAIDGYSDNEIQWDTMTFTNDEGEKVEVTRDMKEILKAAQKAEDCCIIDIRIMKSGDEYYVERSLNVNIWDPHVFSKYDKDEKKLVDLYTFDNESVIGIGQ